MRSNNNQEVHLKPLRLDTKAPLHGSKQCANPSPQPWPNLDISHLKTDIVQGRMFKYGGGTLKLCESLPDAKWYTLCACMRHEKPWQNIDNWRARDESMLDPMYQQV